MPLLTCRCLDTVRDGAAANVFVFHLQQTGTGADIYIHAKMMIVDDCYAAIGSPNPGKIRTFLRLEVAVKVDGNKKPASGEKRHWFAWEETLPDCEPPVLPGRPRRNAVHLARLWQAMIEGHGKSRADLERLA